MAQDNVLQPIIEARQKIGERTAQLTEAKGLLDTLIRDSSDDYDAVEHAFNDLMKHVQREGERALGVANDVATRIAAVTGNAEKYDLDQAALFTAIGTGAKQLTQDSSGGTQTISDTESQLADLDKAMQAMLTGVRQSANDSKTALSGDFDRLTNAHGDWRSELDQNTQTGRDAIDADCIALTVTEFGDWQQQLQTDIQNAQSKIDALQARIDTDVTNQVVELAKAHDQVRQLLTKTFGTLQQTLKDLEALVERLGSTVDESSETMNDLLSATNVGLETVIGLVDTVSALCEEITGLWF